MIPRPPTSTLFPYTTLFRSVAAREQLDPIAGFANQVENVDHGQWIGTADFEPLSCGERLQRSEEHTSELQSRGHLVCRLLLEKKKKINKRTRLRTIIELTDK